MTHLGSIADIIADAANAKPAREVKTIPLNVIDVIPGFSMRRPLTASQDLVTSIKRDGLVTALLVRPSTKGGRFEVLEGHLRLDALKRIKAKTVRVVVQEKSWTYRGRIGKAQVFQCPLCSARKRSKYSKVWCLCWPGGSECTTVAVARIVRRAVASLTNLARNR